MMALGMAYTRGKLKFNVGDYGAMIKNPAMAGPFIKSFTVMGGCRGAEPLRHTPRQSTPNNGCA